MKVLFIAIVIVTLLVPTASKAGGDDWGSVISAEIEKELSKNLSLSFEEEIRLYDNFGTLDRLAHSLGAEYKVCKYLKLSAGYTLMNKNYSYYKEWGNGDVTTKDYWQIRHRFVAAATGTMKLGDFKLSLRERFQYTTWKEDKYKKIDDVRTWLTEDDNKSMLRSRFQFTYDKKKCNWEPFVSVEFHTLLNKEEEDNALDVIRMCLGSEYKINKKNSLELYFRRDENKNEDINRNLICVGYSFKF